MKYEFYNFVITTETEKLVLPDQFVAAKNIKNGKPCNYKLIHKTKQITVFESLNIDNISLISDIFELIDLIEILKAFSSNKLTTDKEYQFNNFSAKLVQKDKMFSVRIKFNDLNYSLFYDKFEATALAAKFSKILNRCEAWQEQGA